MAEKEDKRKGTETDEDERPIGYVANPVEETRERELKAAEDVKKKAGSKQHPDSHVQKAREDAQAQKDAEFQHRDYLRKAAQKRNEEAAKLEIGPTHPLHPRNAGNPSSPTSPVTHDPSIVPTTHALGEGEP
jgi:hypothetical protein